MKVAIAGINGYLGQLISQQLILEGHQVYGIERHFLYGDRVMLQNKIGGCDTIINLAGAPILQRWTAKNKKIIYDSRVQVSKNIVEAINSLSPDERPTHLIQTSAVGIYTTGIQHSEESSDYASGFLGQVVQAWEAPLEKLHHSVKRTIFRLGLVLGKDSQIIQRLKPIFNLGLAATLGKGLQSFPFIHDKDLCKAYLMACEGNLPPSTYNLVAPTECNNIEFTKAFARQLEKRVYFTVPKGVLRIALGEASQLLLENPKVNSEKITAAGLQFRFSNIEDTLRDIMTKEEMKAV